MLKELSLRLAPETAYDSRRLSTRVSKELAADPQRIKRIDTVKRSIDARQRQVAVNLTLRVHLDEIDDTAGRFEPAVYQDVADAPQAIVVGAGPAGLFAALRLIELGVRPVVLERGKDVESRRKDMALISKEQKINPESNYCFGEGGAGAYSDGKLYTRSKKRGSVDKVLQTFVTHGAQPDILVDAHPHIGTDRLPAVIKAIRETIIKSGGEVRFGAKVTDLTVEGKTVTGVMTSDGCLFDGPVILATGHSARDVYAENIFRPPNTRCSHESTDAQSTRSACVPAASSFQQQAVKDSL